MTGMAHLVSPLVAGLFPPDLRQQEGMEACPHPLIPSCKVQGLTQSTPEVKTGSLQVTSDPQVGFFQPTHLGTLRVVNIGKSGLSA